MKSVIEMQTRRDFFQSAVGTFPFPLQTISLRLQQLDEVLLQMQTANQTKCCQMMQLHQLHNELCEAAAGTTNTHVHHKHAHT